MAVKIGNYYYEAFCIARKGEVLVTYEQMIERTRDLGKPADKEDAHWVVQNSIDIPEEWWYNLLIFLGTRDMKLGNELESVCCIHWPLSRPSVKMTYIGNSYDANTLFIFRVFPPKNKWWKVVLEKIFRRR